MLFTISYEGNCVLEDFIIIVIVRISDSTVFKLNQQKLEGHGCRICELDGSKLITKYLYDNRIVLERKES